jgi:hypothetical protein
MDDKSKPGGQDRKLINTHEDYELRDWAASLGVSKDELLEAVKTVGNDADAVRKHLSDRHGKSAGA